MILRIFGVAGRVLVALGVVVLLFVAYQLWGTGILQSRSQSSLRSQLAHELPPGAAAKARGLVTKAGDHASAGALGRTAGTDVTPSGPPELAPPISAPATGQPVGTIQIPSIGLSQVVVEGVQTAQLRTGPGHYPGTPLPGEGGNVAIAGHRTTYAHPFYDLNAVAPGDKIVITTPQGVFVYAARSSSVVPPTDVSVLGATSGAQLTLTTCTPRFSASTRLVLHAVLVQSELFPPTDGRSSVRTSTPKASTTKPVTEHPDEAQAIGVGLGGDGGGGGWLPPVLWGLALAALAVGVWLVGRRARHRWAVYLPGAALGLVVMFFFFTAVSPLLPASL